MKNMYIQIIYGTVCLLLALCHSNHNLISNVSFCIIIIHTHAGIHTHKFTVQCYLSDTLTRSQTE